MTAQNTPFRQWLWKQRNAAQHKADNLKMKVLHHGDMNAYVEYRSLSEYAFYLELTLEKYDELANEEEA